MKNQEKKVAVIFEDVTGLYHVGTQGGRFDTGTRGYRTRREAIAQGLSDSHTHYLTPSGKLVKNKYWRETYYN